uniref:Putative secreted peptide n=1 Tax=Anopheles braziliensis TaxID=58242 RepID=A0A2M3ZXA5_9DIPT
MLQICATITTVAPGAAAPLAGYFYPARKPLRTSSLRCILLLANARGAPIRPSGKPHFVDADMLGSEKKINI